MRAYWSVLLLTAFLFLSLPACQMGGDQVQETPPPEQPLTVTPTVELEEVTPAVIEPTPSVVTITVWGPLEFSPEGNDEAAALVREQIEEFQLLHPGTRIAYEPKLEEGPASLVNYLRAAGAVASSVLPDLIILRADELEEAAQSGVLAPVDSLIDEAIQDDLFPFGTRDTRVGQSWLALPLAVQLEHGVVRAGRRDGLPETLPDWVEEDSRVWLMAGQARSNGDMSDALLLQLLALDSAMPEQESLPPADALTALLGAFRAGEENGSIPREIMSIEEDDPMIPYVQGSQADLVQGDSRRFLAARARNAPVTFAPLPTLAGTQVTVVDGYLLALVTEEPRQQQAAALYATWLLDPARLSAWSNLTHWLPARRSALEGAISDIAYREFVASLLENGWLRPGGSEWQDFSQAVQEQFRAVMLEQVLPEEAVESLESSYRE